MFWNNNVYCIHWLGMDGRIHSKDFEDLEHAEWFKNVLIEQHRIILEDWTITNPKIIKGSA